MIDRDAKEILEREAERLRRILAGLDDPRQELEAAIAALAAGDVRGFQEHTVVGMTILDEMGRVSAGLYDRIPTIIVLGERVTQEEMDASIEHAHRRTGAVLCRGRSDAEVEEALREHRARCRSPECMSEAYVRAHLRERAEGGRGAGQVPP